MTLKTLRKRYPVFTFDKYEYHFRNKTLEIYYYFSIKPDIKLTPKVVIKNIPTKRFRTLNKRALDNLIFHLGMAEIPSYWKSTCSKKINIKAGNLDLDQNRWWKKLFRKGMGQFYFENKIDFTKKDFIKISSSKKSTKTQLAKAKGDKIMIPIGGGKDSAVTLELLKNKNKVTAFLLNSIKSAEDVIAASGVKKTIIIERILDPKLLELNKKGYLNGHTPFSSYLAFLSVLCAYIFEKKEIAFSNESSSEEANTKFLGLNINHQYSKSLEFEKDFQKYNQKYLSNIKYYSFLRKYNELRIAKLFSAMPQYHKVFRSCNIGQKENIWCSNCSKCLSTFIMLLPFLGIKKTTKIFSENLFEKSSLRPLLSSMYQKEKVKPFECLATREEIIMALNFPKDLNILILGFVVEGKSTYKYLKQVRQNRSITISDVQKINYKFNKNTKTVFGKNYLKNLNKYDVIIKSPGIPNKLPEIQKARKSGVIITSQTKIFLNLCKGITIGITGTMGKSTTSSLVQHILTKSKVKSQLVGNIGKPALDFLKKSSRDKHYIFELSSHQLSDLNVSPEIAVLLSIYPEHLDYYKSYKGYARAKENITKNQTPIDHLIYNNSSDLVSSIANRSVATKQKIIDQKFIQDIKLQGEHNKLNASAAAQIAMLLGIKRKTIKNAISTFRPLEHRLENIGTHKGITFINDSISTIPESSIAAINSYSGKVGAIILGGTERSQNYQLLIKKIIDQKINLLILFPQTGKRIFKEIKKYPITKDLKIFQVRSMNKSVSLCFKYLKPGQICLLSPAAPSFNLFNNYADRGNQFKKAVKNLS